MSIPFPEWSSYAGYLSFVRSRMRQLPVIPEDWALHTTNVASDWVEQQFLAHIAGRPLVDPPAELDPTTILSCSQLALLMAHAYQHLIKLDIDIIQYNEALSKQELGMNNAQEEALLLKFPPAERIHLKSPAVVINSRYRIILWYVLDALSPWVQSDMYLVTIVMGDLLKRSVANKKARNWRTLGSNFQPPRSPGITPSCINIAPCWFQQGHECYGPPPENSDNGFKPEVSATLKGDRSLSMIMDMQ